MLHDIHTEKHTMYPTHSLQNNNCSNGMPDGILVQNYYSGVTAQGNPPGVSRICGLVGFTSIQTTTTTTTTNNQEQPSIAPNESSTETPTTTTTPSVVSPPLPPPTPHPEAECPQPFIVVSPTQLQQVFSACVKSCSLCGSKNIRLEVQTKNGFGNTVGVTCRDCVHKVESLRKSIDRQYKKDRR